MSSRTEQEAAREWLLAVAAGETTSAAACAVVILNMLAEQEKRLGEFDKVLGPMVSIRCRGPVSISEV